MKKELINKYLLKFDELNILTHELITNDSKIKSINEFTDILIEAYILGFELANYMLGGEYEIDSNRLIDRVYSTLNTAYDDLTIQDKFNEYLTNDEENRLRVLIENSYHQLYNEGAYDSAKLYGDNVKKMWVTVGDDKVRDTHSYLDGVTTAIDGYFYTYDDDMALYPSGFEKPENNINCRCIVEYILG